MSLNPLILGVCPQAAGLISIYKTDILNPVFMFVFKRVTMETPLLSILKSHSKPIEVISKNRTLPLDNGASLASVRSCFLPLEIFKWAGRAVSKSKRLCTFTAIFFS